MGGSGRVQTRAHTGSGGGGAHGEAPGELSFAGSYGEKSGGSVSQKVELMYRFDVDQQKTR